MVRARFIATALGALAALPVAACGADDTGEVDAGPEIDGGGGDDADADVGDPSLLFRFITVPSVPGAVAGGDYATTLDEVQMSLQEVRSFGDAAPGDERTTQGKVALRFAAEPGANTVYFPDAPPSRYSHLAAQIQSYSMTGTVVLDQDPIPFSITDTPPIPLAVYVDLEGVVVVDALVEVDIAIEIGEVTTEINWESFDPGSTSVEIDGSSAVIGDVREHVAEAFGHEEESLTDD